MYASGEIPEIGDIVSGSGGEAKVLAVVRNGMGGQESASVQWTTPRERVPGSGMYGLLAPITVPTNTLTLIRRGDT